MSALDKAGGLAVIALICTICIGQVSAKGEVGCFDEDGQSVDWYIGYKFPRSPGKGEFDTGYVYAYITSNDVQEPVNDNLQTERRAEDPDSTIYLSHFRDLLVKFGGPFRRRSENQSRSRLTRPRKNFRRERSSNANWVASQKLINDPESAIMRTLKPAYQENLYDHISSVFYNDDPDGTEAPEELDDDEDKGDSGEENRRSRKNKASRVAHAKGAILMDEESNTGVWLTHSVPRFPNVRQHILEFPASGRLFGQTFMCISFDLRKYGANVVDHLVNMRPLVYDRRVTSSLLREIPSLENLNLYRNSKFKRTPNPGKLAQTITTKGGQVLKLYSKAATFQHDLYGGWIDEDLGSDLYVETWRRGSGGVLNSSCPKNEHHVNNVKDLKYGDVLTWDYLTDHSKWAITDEQNLATVCIADSNRMNSQFRRGSGAVCIRCPTCWSVFSNTILDTEPCPINTNKGARRQINVDKSLKTRIEEYLKATEQ